ncbi:ADP-ribosylglycohydrolase family protein [Bacillus sp. Marseille-P3661]|uniref:ADP-ribosylglycohydrolase family protein n=1 Tax=Bacillus sp. Marseille-P3661 TaxID=1936234 RepID=UPI000C850A46|nr:ADP-ribosylglycohydrolase family protein [Bacillus sp. Marseille-P3661]
MKHKILSGLFGLAIGDALGGTTEFMTSEEINKKYGKLTDIIGGGYWRLEPGKTTDDTAMTMAVAKGILKNFNSPIEEMGNEFTRWFDTKPKDVGSRFKQPLITI